MDEIIEKDRSGPQRVEPRQHAEQGTEAVTLAESGGFGEHAREH